LELARDVCNEIYGQMQLRFAFSGHLAAASLLAAENFAKYEK
jgi:hypothetical protein